jgi:ABC-2 type transport system permease protein
VMYALIFVTEGFVSLFLEGIWQLGFKVNRGEFDYYLVRPVSPVIQLLTCDVGMNGLGNIVVGGALITQALVRGNAHLTAGQGVLALLLFLCAMAIRASISFAANALGFWTQSPNNSAPLMIHNLSDFGKYPLTIYSLWLRPLIIAVIPYAFVSFFPAAYVFNRGFWAKAALLAPVVAVYAALVARWVFRAGLARYESAGT